MSSMWETTTTRRRRLPGEDTCKESRELVWCLILTRHGEPAPVSELLVTARAIKISNPIFYDYIRILLIKTNSVIYICYIKYRGNVEKICARCGTR